VIKGAGYTITYGIPGQGCPTWIWTSRRREEKERLALDFGLYDESEEVAIYLSRLSSGVSKLARRSFRHRPTRGGFPGAGAAASVTRNSSHNAGGSAAASWIVSEQVQPAELLASSMATIRNRW